MSVHRASAGRGLGKLELVLLILLSAVVLAIAVPQVKRSRIDSNENAAIEALVTIATSQESWVRLAVVDQDDDTVGEYGLLGELAGALVPRSRERTTEPVAGQPGKAWTSFPGQKKPAVPAAEGFASGGVADPAFIPPLLATAGREGEDGCAVMNGYAFRAFLVRSVSEDWAIIAGDDKSLGGTPSEPGATLSDVDAIDLQERSYVVYAWPMEAGHTGERAFVVNQGGQVYSTDMTHRTYSGRGSAGAKNVPPAGAAFEGGPFVTPLHVGDHVGGDGNLWTATGYRRP